MEYQQFINFLKRNKVYDSYFKYFFSVEENEDNEHWIRFKYKLKTPIELFNYQSSQMIVDGFKWSDTLEDNDFWMMIHNKWVKCWCNNIK